MCSLKLKNFRQRLMNDEEEIWPPNLKVTKRDVLRFHFCFVQERVHTVQLVVEFLLIRIGT